MVRKGKATLSQHCNGKGKPGKHSGGKGKRGRDCTAAALPDSERNGCDMQSFAMAQRWIAQRSGGDDSYDSI